ncbi:MAG: hypothetical protein HQK56_20280, partial [Deltaproteobacteria bacterium]|nr:hypothetical protein [Deltaproteobacteria bacterium]
MKVILKSFIGYPTLKKWNSIKDIYPSLDGRDRFFDSIYTFIDECYRQHDSFPTLTIFQRTLTVEGDHTTLNYITNLISDPEIGFIQEDVEFVNYVAAIQQLYLKQDLATSFNQALMELNSSERQPLTSTLSKIDELTTKLAKTKSVFSREAQSVATLQYGEQAQQRAKDVYAKIKQKKHDQESLYFDLGFKGLEPVQIKA